MITGPTLMLRVLTRARDLIAEPTHWTKGEFARNEYGYSVGIDSPNACCFCTIGAVRRACYEEGLTYTGVSQAAIRKLCRCIAETLPYTDYDGSNNVAMRYNIAAWNDAEERTHDDVMNVFQCAIDAAKREVYGDQND